MHSEVEGLLFSSVALPLIEAISRNQSPSARQGISESGLLGIRLRPRIDRTKADFASTCIPARLIHPCPGGRSAPIQPGCVRLRPQQMLQQQPPG